MDCAVVGIGMTPFGAHLDRSLKSLGSEAVGAALRDGGVEPNEVDVAFVANSFGGPVVGQTTIVAQTVLHEAGIGGVPSFTVDNACAGSSSAVYLALQALRTGAARVALVVGVEKLLSEDEAVTFRCLNGGADLDFVRSSGIDPGAESVFSTVLYPMILERYASSWGLDINILAEIAVKNRTNAGRNPYARYRTPLTVDEVLAARVVAAPLTTLMCAPPADGAAALVIAAAPAVSSSQRPVWVGGCATMMGGGGNTFERVADLAYREAGVGPSDICVAEVNDSTALGELRAYEHVGFCEPGGGAKYFASGASTPTGRTPVNTSGGLMSRGHPSAATGAAQIAELVWQLRGEAGPRQVPEGRAALAQSNGGFVGGDAAVAAVCILSRQRPS